jgi:hypothetical protein
MNVQVLWNLGNLLTSTAVLSFSRTVLVKSDLLIKYEGYSESNLWWTVNKTSNERKNILYTKNMYVLKLLLNIVTAGIEALVASGNKFLYACVKEICHLWAQLHFDTFHQLLIIVEALWSHPVLHVGKQVVVTQSEIRAVRRVVKQPPVKVLQQRSITSSCMRVCIVMETHYIGYQHSVPFVLNGPTKFFYCFAIHF